MLINKFFPLTVYGTIKTPIHALNLENQLIAEIQLPEQNDGKISVIDMRTENVAEKIENPHITISVSKSGKSVNSRFLKTELLIKPPFPLT